MKKDTIDIAFAIGDSYSQHCCVAMASILYNNKDFQFRFHVLSDYISTENKSRFGGLHKLGTDYEIIYHEVSPDAFEGFGSMLGRISSHGYYRYIIADLLPETGKCLYLDSDIVINGSLRGLWETDIENYYCAGVEDFGATEEQKDLLDLSGHTYINSGMLLLNLRKIREEKMIPKLFSTTCEVLGKGMEYIDQDTINCVFKDSILVLPAIYNYATANSRHMPQLARDAVVIHYTLACKPWTPTGKSHHKMRGKYFKYLRMTPYSGFSRKYRRERLKYGLSKLNKKIKGRQIQKGSDND